MVLFHADRQMDHDCQKHYKGWYLFIQPVCYGLGVDLVCRKIKVRHKFQYDLNATPLGPVYTSIPEPGSKRASYRAARNYPEKPFYKGSACHINAAVATIVNHLPLK